MTKTNATAKTARKSAAQAKAERQESMGNPARLTDEKPARLTDEKPARKGKVLTEKDLAGKNPTAKERNAKMDRELQQESEATGAVRVADMITLNGINPSAPEYHLVGPGTNNALSIPNHMFIGDVAKAAEIGKSFRAFKAIWAEAKKASPAKLANGLDGRNAPHASKAVADKRGAAKQTNKADAATQKPATVAKAKRTEERKAKAAPKADDNRKVTIIDKKFTYGKDGSARNASWLACKASKTVTEYAAKGGALKYLPRWVSAGAIKLG